MSSFAVSIQDVTYSYDQKLALDKLCLKVPAKSRFGILGPNGSGKSTLFKILSTLLPLQQGEATLHDVRLSESPNAVRKLLGVTFQSPSLDNKLTVAENLWCQGMIYGLNADVIQHNIHDALTVLQLEDRKHELVEKLSGGLKRRVEIAKSLLHRPRILLMDEPSTGLDPLARHELWQYLSKLVELHDMTLLFTTHLMDEADQCDQIMLMHQGKDVITGTPLELKRSLSSDIIRIKSPEPAQLFKNLQAEHGDMVKVQGATIRIESPVGSQLLFEITQKFRPMIQEISLHQPTLEDLFLAHTGKTFQSDV